MSPNRPRSGRVDDKLESWKEIAAYLHRDVRTAVRWERMRGLPVYRVPGGGKAGVYALKSELDSWWKGASLQMHEDATDTLAQTPTPSVAVLPFSNLSPDKANEYFGDGLADGIITLLTRIPRLRVTARTSSFAFRGREPSPPPCSFGWRPLAASAPASTPKHTGTG